jgi:hypothetical protein|tara:strand:+ start:94 stop:588 length:495 start_codon:yes stop_codon:yes gene_type:complete
MKKKIVPYVIAAGTALVSAVPVLAVPVVPNFQQGSMTSHTETESTVTETINSIDYRTGWEYTVSGVGISADGDALNPNVNTSTVTVTPSVGSATGTGGASITGNVTSSYDSLDFSTSPTFTITTPGEAFQFVQSYQGPGLTNQTIIQRVTSIQSVTDTTSTFTQ